MICGIPLGHPNFVGRGLARGVRRAAAGGSCSDRQNGARLEGGSPDDRVLHPPSRQPKERKKWDALRRGSDRMGTEGSEP